MPNEKIKIVREDLYEQVWNEPILKLAKQYGLSDVGLAKICKKMGIPRPSRGYWARVNSGRIPPKPRLPKLKDDQPAEVILYPKEMVSLTANEHTEVDRLISQEKDPDYLINVTEELTNPHRFIDRTAKSLRGAKANDHHIVRPRAKHCLDVEITKDSIDRAMRVMDALIKALEQRGFGVAVSEQEQTQVTILGETLGIHLEERIQRVPHVMTSKEEKRVARDPYYHFQIPDFDYQPTGKLTFSIVGHYLYGRGIRSSWSDAKIQRLENCLNSILAGLITAASVVKAKRLEDERKAREWAEEQRRRDELREQREREQARLDLLREQTRDWMLAQQIRSYVMAVRASDSNGIVDAYVGLETDEWAFWASQQADRLDPLVTSPASVLDEKFDRYW